MKKYKGTCKVKADSTYIYKGKSFEITGVYMEYKNGNGVGVLADGTRDYKLSLKGTEFEGKYGAMTVIHDRHLENIELFQTIELPLTETETLELIQFTRDEDSWYSSEKTLEAFILANTHVSVLPIPDLTSLYNEEDWNKRVENLHSKNI